jgi:hypothetical protein
MSSYIFIFLYVICVISGHCMVCGVEVAGTMLICCVSKRVVIPIHTYRYVSAEICECLCVPGAPIACMPYLPHGSSVTKECDLSKVET